MRSFERDSKRCSSFCVSISTCVSWSQMVSFLVTAVLSSRISRQNSFTVFFCLREPAVSGDGVLLGGTTKKPAGGGGSGIRPGGGGGGMADWKGNGGGIRPHGIGGGAGPALGGGGGGTAPNGGGGGGGGGTSNKGRTLSGSPSSSATRSVKSRSHICRGRSSVARRLSQCSSFSDFFGSHLAADAPTGPPTPPSVRFRRSWRDFDLISSSLALEMIPLTSPSRITLSSVVGATATVDMWFACSQLKNTFHSASCEVIQV